MNCDMDSASFLDNGTVLELVTRPGKERGVQTRKEPSSLRCDYARSYPGAIGESEYVRVSSLRQP